MLTDDVRDLRSVGFNDRAMSARIRPGGAWELCVSADYDDCRLVSESIPDLNAIEHQPARLVRAAGRRRKWWRQWRAVGPAAADALREHEF